MLDVLVSCLQSFKQPFKFVKARLLFLHALTDLQLMATGKTVMVRFCLNQLDNTVWIYSGILFELYFTASRADVDPTNAQFVGSKLHLGHSE